MSQAIRKDEVMRRSGERQFCINCRVVVVEDEASACRCIRIRIGEGKNGKKGVFGE